MNEIPPSLAAAVGRLDPWVLLSALVADNRYPLQVFAPDGRSLYVNDAFRRSFGAESPAGYSVLDDAALASAGLTAQLRRAFAGERVELPPIWHDSAGGGAVAGQDDPPRYLRLRALPICDTDGAVVLVIVQFEDLTEQHRTREERERLLAERDAVLRQSPAGIIICGPDGRFRLVNEAAVRIWGGRPAESAPLDWSAYRAFTPDGEPLPPERAPLARALTGETVEAEELQVERFDGGTGTLLAGAAPLRNPDGSLLGAVMVFADVSHFRELERLRDQFISVAAHELRTPLTTLLGYSQLLSRRVKIGATREQLEAGTENILRAGRRLDVLVNQLVDVARLERGSLVLLRKPCDLAAIARRSIEDVAFRYPRPTFTLDAPAAVEGEWDGGRLEQVLSNLLDNAVKYGHANGTVTLRLEETPEAVAVTVENEGGGLEEPELRRVFDRYFRASLHQQGPTPGMGLGLFTAREVVQAHGGAIRAGNRPGGGLTVTFTLPRECRV